MLSSWTWGGIPEIPFPNSLVSPRGRGQSPSAQMKASLGPPFQMMYSRKAHCIQRHRPPTTGRALVPLGPGSHTRQDILGNAVWSEPRVGLPKFRLFCLGPSPNVFLFFCQGQVSHSQSAGQPDLLHGKLHIFCTLLEEHIESSVPQLRPKSER